MIWGRDVAILLFLGGDVATIAGLTQAAFTAERNFLNTASKSKKPSDKVIFIQGFMFSLKKWFPPFSKIIISSRCWERYV